MHHVQFSRSPDQRKVPWRCFHHVRPTAHVLSGVVVAVAICALVVSLVICAGLSAVPALPFITVAGIGIPVGIVIFLLTRADGHSSDSPSPRDSSAHSHSKPRKSHEHLPASTPDAITGTSSMEDICKYAIQRYYSQPYPSYEAIEVIPGEGKEKVKWISLSPDEQVRMLREGSNGTGGRAAVAKINELLAAGRSSNDSEIQEIIKSRVCSAGKSRGAHGPPHALRCVVLIDALIPIYRELFPGFADADLTDEGVHVLKIAALLHDAGREGGGSDVFEENSAQIADELLQHMGIADDLRRRAVNAIRHKDAETSGKDLFAILLHEVDCLEYQRISSRPFDAKHLNADKLSLLDNTTEEGRDKQIARIVKAEKNFIEKTQEFPSSADYAAFHDAAVQTGLIPSATSTDLQSLIRSHAEDANKLSAQIGLSLPTEIRSLTVVKTSKENLQMVVKSCRAILRQLGADIKNEADARAIHLGRSLESIIICCTAIDNEWVVPAKLQTFAKGKFNTTYTFNEGETPKIFKPIVPDLKPNHCDMERRYGISQFTSVARNLAPGKVNDFLAHVGAASNTTVPKVYISSHLGVVDGRCGLVMDKAENHPHAAQKSDGNFRQMETWLQLMDCILGEMDRHSKNVFYDQKNVHAIDFDVSFPDQELRNRAEVTDRNGKFKIKDSARQKIQSTKLTEIVPTELSAKRKSAAAVSCAVDRGAGLSNYCMPKVIDEDMKTVVFNIDEAKLREMLIEIGLSDRQIDATIERLRAIRAHIHNGHTAVIPNGTWSSNSEIPNLCTANNSYFLRHPR